MQQQDKRPKWKGRTAREERVLNWELGRVAGGGRAGKGREKEVHTKQNKEYRDETKEYRN